MEDIFKQIKELCEFEELYHDGINIDIKSLCDKGLKLLKGDKKDMGVVRDGKTLYHIQNNDLGSDGYPLDTYIWCAHYPTEEDMRTAWDLEYGDGYGKDNEMLNKWLTSSEIYAVFAEEL